MPFVVRGLFERLFLRSSVSLIPVSLVFSALLLNGAAFGQAPESCTSNILYSADVPGTSEDPALCFASQARCETPIDDGRF
ncbi:MAG: hypothetical protein AAF604_24660, partial [Acidobacteriota bacterium]